MYKKCIRCDNRRKPLRRSHKICKICYKLLYKSSGNNDVDYFIGNTQTNDGNMMEFVSYNQFNNIQFIAEGEFSKIYKATWIDGNIQGWIKEKLNFKRSGPREVVLKQFSNSKHVTFE